MTYLGNIYPSLSTEIEEIAEGLKNRGFSQSAEQILELQQIDHSEESVEPLSLASVKGFSRLIHRLKFLGEPTIGMFSAGTLSAEWETPEKQSLLIEFLDADRALFVLTCPESGKSKGKISCSANNLSHDELMKKLAENSVEE